MNPPAGASRSPQGRAPHREGAITCVMLLLLAAALADDAARVTLTVDPLTTLLGYAHLQVEARAGRWMSVYAGPHLRLFSAPWAEPEPYVGIGAEAGARFFPWGAAPRGMWVMARGVLASVRSDGLPSRAGGYTSALVGGTWMPDAPKGKLRPMISLGAGAQWIDYRIGAFGTSGPFPALHTSGGVAW